MKFARQHHGLSRKKALALLSGAVPPFTRSVLVKMHTPSIPNGYAYYITGKDGGYVSPETAESLKRHPQIEPGEDGLLPGHDQTWRMI